MGCPSGPRLCRAKPLASGPHLAKTLRWSLLKAFLSSGFDSFSAAASPAKSAKNKFDVAAPMFGYFKRHDDKHVRLTPIMHELWTCPVTNPPRLLTGSV